MKYKPLLIVLGEPYSTFSEIVFKYFKSKKRTKNPILFIGSSKLIEKQWDNWLDLFTDDGHYWMPAEEDQLEGHGVPNIFWENHDMMKMRIRRNEHPQAHSQAPNNRLCHVVSNVIIENEEST